jgi:glycine C-acetyltransferase
MRLSDRLFELKASSLRGSRFRRCPRGRARVRTIVTATHTREELQFALDVFETVGTELGIA